MATDEKTQTLITQLEKHQESLFRWLRTATVTTDEEQKNAEDMLIAARNAIKEGDELRKTLTQPLDESKKRIIALFKPYMDRLDQGISTLRKELGNYHENKRIEADAARLTALAEEAARIRAAGSIGEVLEPLAKPVVAEVEKTSRTNLGTVSYRKDYDIQIVDPDQVPRDLCEPSMPKIRARVKSGVLKIPGVLVSPKTISTARGG